jgi:hypothetical protein
MGETYYLKQTKTYRNKKAPTMVPSKQSDTVKERVVMQKCQKSFEFDA